MFPDDFTFNLLIDSFIKDQDFKGLWCCSSSSVWLDMCMRQTQSWEVSNSIQELVRWWRKWCFRSRLSESLHRFCHFMPSADIWLPNLSSVWVDECVDVLLDLVWVLIVNVCVVNVQWQEERIMGASLMLAGLKQENSVGFSARLLGLALIGVYALVMGETKLFEPLSQLSQLLC